MRNKSEYPAFFARFYDTFYRHLRDAHDYRFYMNRILSAKGPVLEVGAGTGRFFKDALEKGADIYGIDISPAMIDVLKTKLPEKHHHRVAMGISGT